MPAPKNALDTRMSPEAFEALCKLIRTRESPTRTAMRLMIVEGVPLSDAATETGTAEVTLYGARRRYLEALELAKVAAGVDK